TLSPHHLYDGGCRIGGRQTDSAIHAWHLTNGLAAVRRILVCCHSDCRGSNLLACARARTDCRILGHEKSYCILSGGFERRSADGIARHEHATTKPDACEEDGRARGAART